MYTEIILEVPNFPNIRHIPTHSGSSYGVHLKVLLHILVATSFLQNQMNSTEVQNPRRKLDDVFMLIICVWILFLPVQSLPTCFRSSSTRFADFVSN